MPEQDNVVALNPKTDTEEKSGDAGETIEESKMVEDLAPFETWPASEDMADSDIKGTVPEMGSGVEEIEEDIVPFGFIDDGEEQIRKLEVTEEHPWAIEHDKNL